MIGLLLIANQRTLSKAHTIIFHKLRLTVMKTNTQIIVLAFLSFSFTSFAEQINQSNSLITLAATEKEKNTEEEENEFRPDDPIDMKALPPPNFSLQELEPAENSQIANLQLTSMVLNNSDLADTSSGSSEDTSTIFYNGASLSLMPKLRDTTRLAANVDGSFIRYDGDAVNDYNTLSAKLGLFQQLGSNTSAELGWLYRQYYVSSSSGLLSQNPKDLQEQGVRMALKRTDTLPLDFFWDNNYEFQANFSDPVDRSRLSHYFTTGLGYKVTNKLQGAVFYRLKHDDFTHRSFNENSTRHEFQAQLSYQLVKYINIAGTVSYLFGDTIDLLRDPILSNGVANSNSHYNLNNIALGLRIRANIPLLD